MFVKFRMAPDTRLLAMFQEQHDIRTLLQCLEQYRGEQLIQEAGLKALAQMTLQDDSRLFSDFSQAIAGIFTSLQRHRKCCRVQGWGLKALMTVGKDSEDWKQPHHLRDIWQIIQEHSPASCLEKLRDRAIKLVSSAAETIPPMSILEDLCKTACRVLVFIGTTGLVHPVSQPWRDSIPKAAVDLLLFLYSEYPSAREDVLGVVAQICHADEQHCACLEQRRGMDMVLSHALREVGNRTAQESGDHRQTVGSSSLLVQKQHGISILAAFVKNSNIERCEFLHSELLEAYVVNVIQTSKMYDPGHVAHCISILDGIFNARDGVGPSSQQDVNVHMLKFGHKIVEIMHTFKTSKAVIAICFKVLRSIASKQRLLYFLQMPLCVKHHASCFWGWFADEMYFAQISQPCRYDGERGLAGTCRDYYECRSFRS